jgi:proline iminopeptidase
MRPCVALALLLTAVCGAAAHGQVARVGGHAPGAGGVSIYYEIVGAAPDTLLFLHGTPSTMYSLARDFDELAREFTLVFFDQRGGGRSTPLLGADSLRWQDHVADIEALRVHLGIGRMHLFGMSWGSALAVLYAHAHPDRVRRLVLLPMRARHDPEVPAAPGPLAATPDSAQQRRLQLLLAEWPRAADPVTVCEEYWRLQLPFFFARPERAAHFRASLCEEPPETLRHSWAVSTARMRSLGEFDLRPTLAAIEAPVLVVKGTITTMPHAWTEEWARALPNARMHWVSDAGLLPWIEQPDGFFPAVRQFLRGDGPAATTGRCPTACRWRNFALPSGSGP